MSMISEQVKRLRRLETMYGMNCQKELAGCLGKAADTIESLSAKLQAANCGGWIPCEDGENMPPEHDSIFAKFKGTDKWQHGMFEKSSDNVNITAEFEDGTRKTKTSHTIDGEWDKFASAVKFKVIAWQPLPEPYHE